MLRIDLNSILNKQTNSGPADKFAIIYWQTTHLRLPNLNHQFSFFIYFNRRINNKKHHTTYYSLATYSRFSSCSVLESKFTCFFIETWTYRLVINSRHLITNNQSAEKLLLLQNAINSLLKTHLLVGSLEGLAAARYTYIRCLIIIISCHFLACDYFLVNDHAYQIGKFAGNDFINTKWVCAIKWLAWKL